MPEMYEPSNGGQEYNVPLDGDVADAPLAFKNFSESMPPEYVPVKDITATYEVLASDNGHILVASSDSDVTFAGDLPEGFNVALTLSAPGTITLNGVVGENSIPFEKIGSVVMAGTVLYSSVSIGEVIEVEGASGGPTAPTSITVSGNLVTSGPAGEGDAGPPIAYGAKVTSELEGDTFTWELDQPADPILNGPEVVLSGTTPFTNYQVEIFGLNVAGRGEGIVSEKFQMNYNVATGGTETIVDNYNGTNEKWAVHTFTGDGTFTASESNQPFRVLIVGGGGSSGPSPNDSGYIGGGGGGGGVYELSTNIEVGPHAVVIGDGGSSGSWPYGAAPIVGARSANPSSIVIGGLTVQAGGGGTGGNGPNGGNYSPTLGANGGPNGYASGGTGSGPGKNAQGGTGGNITSNISGSDVLYSKPNDNSQPNRGWSASVGKGVRGTHGVVVVAYQIGTSTTREIQQAQAEAAARQAGVEEGLEQGIQQGYSQAQEDLQEELTSLRTQIAGAVGTAETMLIDGKEKEVKRTRRGGKK